MCECGFIKRGYQIKTKKRYGLIHHYSYSNSNKKKFTFQFD